MIQWCLFVCLFVLIDEVSSEKIDDRCDNAKEEGNDDSEAARCRRDGVADDASYCGFLLNPPCFFWDVLMRKS